MGDAETSIKISSATRDQLKNLGTKSETFDDLLLRLIQERRPSADTEREITEGMRILAERLTDLEEIAQRFLPSR